ncbi:hypothetical protein MLD38_024842 [Melastoma candidum]|uniref:Uncharacterized protein n=1 Tax=Melastoma candidum TaxID=119954 RepID=A0ACB9NUI2_9MYRT|nr:hypothetical protein MLD38_024842 [Melastoma candidum]
MGCTNSKLDRLPAVSLCRHRCRSLDHALLQSYALADAHLAYLRSLRAFGSSLRSFVTSGPAPELGCGDPTKVPLHPASPGRSSSSSAAASGSHIHFNSDSDHDDHRKPASDSFRLEQVGDYFNPVEALNPSFDRLVSISYQRSQPAQSFAYIQPTYGKFLNQAITAGLELKPQPPAPPPPPPPSNATWDFLNFFDAYDLSGSSGRRHNVFNPDVEVTPIKPETGVPVSAVHKKIVVPEVEEIRADISKAKSEKPASNNPANQNFTEPAHEVGREDLGNVMEEVTTLFEKASDSGTAVLRTLDNAKFRYRSRSCIHQVSSKVLQAISPSQCLKQGTAATPPGDGIDLDLIGSDEDAMVGSRNFTSTLKKLYMWEKKLYGEVKTEEKLRIVYTKKCKELKHMVEKEQRQPGDAERIEAGHALIRSLSTQLKISLHVADTISDRIIKLRDEDLWTFFCQLIHGWLEMWRVMAECHRRQGHAIAKAKAKAPDMIISNQKKDYGLERLEEAMQVKLDLQNLELCFCNWVAVQEDCIRALDSWLTRCLSSELEGSPLLSEIAPPPMFDVCRSWTHAINKSRVMRVTGTMSELVGIMGGFYNSSYARLHAKALEDKDLELKMKTLERKDQRMKGQIRRAIKRGTIPPAEVGLGIEEGELGGMSRVRTQLENMFEAMAKYSAHCVEAYEELCKLCDEKHLKKA